jgi:hypothetical protein
VEAAGEGAEATRLETGAPGQRGDVDGHGQADDHRQVPRGQAAVEPRGETLHAVAVVPGDQRAQHRGGKPDDALADALCHAPMLRPERANHFFRKPMSWYGSVAKPEAPKLPSVDLVAMMSGRW